MLRLNLLLLLLTLPLPLWADKPVAPERIPGSTRVSAEEAITLIQTTPELVIIDARHYSEYAKGHIEGAIQLLDTNMTREALAQHAPRLDQPLLFYCNGERCKSSRDLSIGMTLQIRQGYDELTVIVKALSEQRRGAPEAALLYEETPESRAAREAAAAQRKAERAGMETHSGRPTKQDRRHIHRLKREFLDS